MKPTICRSAKDTLTVVELLHGECLEFRRMDGSVAEIELIATGARILETSLATRGVCEPKGRTVYDFWAELAIEGKVFRLERIVGTQKSFYPPWEIEGLLIWLDAVDDIFEFLLETHGWCRPAQVCMEYLPPRYHARLALQDAALRICPERVHFWCPLPPDTLRIEDCYRGEDCWLGAFDGASAHAGLDINHAPCTPLYAPIGFDDQFSFNSLARGHNNNRWLGTRRWPNGAQWILQSHHMTSVLVPEHTPVTPNLHYAEGSGVWSGDAHHSHFEFKIQDYGRTVPLDPWILFWQMYRDQDGDSPVISPGRAI